METALISAEVIATNEEFICFTFREIKTCHTKVFSLLFFLYNFASQLLSMTWHYLDLELEMYDGLIELAGTPLANFTIVTDTHNIV